MVFDLPCYFLWSCKGIKTYIHEYGDVLSLVLIYNMIIYTILHISHKFLQITLCTESKCISNTLYIYSFFFNFCIFCCCCSVAKSCLTLCDSMDCNDSGFSVPHHLPKFAQVHVYCIRDTIQPSYPLLPSFNSLEETLMLGKIEGRRRRRRQRTYFACYILSCIFYMKDINWFFVILLSMRKCGIWVFLNL